MYFRYDYWTSLQGLEVQVWRGATLLRTGMVDAVSDDSTIAWIAADATERRQLFEKASGYVLKINSTQLILKALSGRGTK